MASDASHNTLHSQGHQSYQKELTKTTHQKIKEIRKSSLPKKDKQNLMTNIISHFKQLLKDSDHSLFLK